MGKETSAQQHVEKLSGWARKRRPTRGTSAVFSISGSSSTTHDVVHASKVVSATMYLRIRVVSHVVTGHIGSLIGELMFVDVAGDVVGDMAG